MSNESILREALETILDGLDSTEYGYHLANAALAATAPLERSEVSAPQQREDKDAEREAFEAWATENCHLSGSKFHKWDNGDYLDRDLAKAWFGWQARAAQSQPVIPTGTPAADVPECKECKGSGDSGWCGPCKVCDGSGIAPTVPAIQVQEPVAWLYEPLEENDPWRKPQVRLNRWEKGSTHGWKDTPLYTTPQPEQTSSEEYWGRPGKRLDDHLAQMEGVRKAVKELEAEYAQPEQTALMQGIHDAAVKAGIIKDGTPLTGPQCLMLLTDLANMAQPEQTAEPRGFVLMPLCVTEEMIDSVQNTLLPDHHSREFVALLYRRFLKARPEIAQQSNAPALSDEQIDEIASGIFPDTFYSKPFRYKFARAILLAAQGSKP